MDPVTKLDFYYANKRRHLLKMQRSEDYRLGKSSLAQKIGNLMQRSEENKDKDWVVGAKIRDFIKRLAEEISGSYKNKQALLALSAVADLSFNSSIRTYKGKQHVYVTFQGCEPNEIGEKTFNRRLEEAYIIISDELNKRCEEPEQRTKQEPRQAKVRLPTQGQHRELDLDELVRRIKERTDLVVSMISSRLRSHNISLAYLPRKQSESIKQQVVDKAGSYLISGEAMVGKSHLLIEMTKQISEKQGCLPVLIADDDITSFGLASLLPQYFGKETELEILFDRLSGLGFHISVLLDALDRLPIGSLTNQLCRLQAQVLRAGGSFIATCRPIESYEVRKLLPFSEVFELGVLSIDEKKLLVELLRQNTGQQLEVLNNQDILSLCRTPGDVLMVAGLTSFREDTCPVKNMQDVINHFWLEKVAAFKARGQSYTYPQLEIIKRRKEDIVGRLAISMLEQDQLTIDEFSGLGQLSDQDVELLSELTSDGVIVQIKGHKQPPPITFFHQRFFEYAAAHRLNRTSSYEKLFNNISKPLSKGIVSQCTIQLIQLDKQKSLKTFVESGLSEKPLGCLGVVEGLLATAEGESYFDVFKSLFERNEWLCEYVLANLPVFNHDAICGLLFPLVLGFARTGSYEKYDTKRRITEALPLLVKINPTLTLEIMEIMREDYDEKEMHSDLRRRVVESVPTAFDYLPAQSARLLSYRPLDQIFVSIASAEAVCEIFRHHEQIPNFDIRTYKKSFPRDHHDAVNFVFELEGYLAKNIEQAFEFAEKSLTSSDSTIRIIIARNLQYLLDKEPERTLKLMNICMQDPEKNVGRPIVRALPDIIRTAKLKQHSRLKDSFEQIVSLLACSEDKLVRSTLVDSLGLMMEWNPELAFKVGEHLLDDPNNKLTRIRASCILLRMTEFDNSEPVNKLWPKIEKTFMQE